MITTDAVGAVPGGGMGGMTITEAVVVAVIEVGGALKGAGGGGVWTRVIWDACTRLLFLGWYIKIIIFLYWVSTDVAWEVCTRCFCPPFVSLPPPRLVSLRPRLAAGSYSLMCTTQGCVCVFFFWGGGALISTRTLPRTLPHTRAATTHLRYIQIISHTQLI
jgi:hypothetical protein